MGQGEPPPGANHVSEFDERLGQFLARLREQSGVSQESLAGVLGRDQPTVSRVERGVRRVAVQDLLQWLNALGLGLSEVAPDLEALRGAVDSSSLWSEPDPKSSTESTPQA